MWRWRVFEVEHRLRHHFIAAQPNSMLPFGLMPRSTMLPGGAQFAQRSASHHGKDRSAPRLRICALHARHHLPHLRILLRLAATAGSALISGCVAGVACVRKRGTHSSPEPLHKSRIFFFHRVIIIVEPKPDPMVVPFRSLRAARNKRYNPGNQRSQHTDMPFTEEGANSARWR